MNLKVKLMDGYTLLRRIEKYAKENDWFDDELDLIRGFINNAPELDLSMWNGWTAIKSEDDLPDEDGYYLVTARDEWGDSVYKIAWFTLQNPLVCPSPKGIWSNETGKYKNLAWTTVPPLYSEDENA